MKKMLFLFIFLLLTFPAYAEESLDIKLSILGKEIAPDEPLRFQVEVFRLGEERKDVYFEYFIKKDEGLRFIKSESVAVEKIVSFVRSIELPASVQEGHNALFVKASMSNIKGGAVDSFEVLKPEGYVFFSNNYIFYLFLFLILAKIILIITLMVNYIMISKYDKIHNRVGEKDI